MEAKEEKKKIRCTICLGKKHLLIKPPCDCKSDNGYYHKECLYKRLTNKENNSFVCQCTKTIRLTEFEASNAAILQSLGEGVLCTKFLVNWLTLLVLATGFAAFFMQIFRISSLMPNLEYLDYILWFSISIYTYNDLYNMLIHNVEWMRLSSNGVFYKIRQMLCLVIVYHYHNQKMLESWFYLYLSIVWMICMGRTFRLIYNMFKSKQPADVIWIKKCDLI
jgi:hypothetical protein